MPSSGAHAECELSVDVADRQTDERTDIVIA